jgi:hypothetical protein
MTCNHLCVRVCLFVFLFFSGQVMTSGADLARLFRTEFDKLAVLGAPSPVAAPPGEALPAGAPPPRESLSWACAERPQRAAGCLTVLLYGQTGTGKTYSMKELADLFFKRSASSGACAAPAGAADAGFVYEVQCFEVLHKGNTVFDLLDSRKKVPLLQGCCRAPARPAPCDVTFVTFAHFTLTPP